MGLTVLAHDWTLKAREKQIPPLGAWFVWLIHTGRGWGKTRTAAEYIRSRVDSRDWRTVNVAGPTWTDVMDTMVQGSEQAPGLMGIWPAHQKPSLRMSKDDPHLRTHNGAKIRLRAAHQAERFRGPQADGGWADEIDSWKPERMTAAKAWSNYELGIRLGDDPRIVATSTPKRRGLVRILRERPSTVVTTGSTYENKANLAAAFFANVIDPMEGTTAGRQEVGGEVLEETDGSIVNREMIDAARVDEAPELTRVVVGVDPSGTKTGDSQGIVAKGKGIDRHGYTLADRSCNLSPEGWGRRAVDVYHEFDADCMVVEVNYGGDMCESVIRGIDSSVRVKKVHASRGKHVRFEPMGGRYERGEEHHVGTFKALEDEICAFTPDGYDGDESPGRADAAVWATTELFPVRPGVSPDEALAFMRGEGARA